MIALISACSASDSELVKCLLQIVEKGLPLCRRYHEMLVQLLIRAPCWSAGGPADHFRNEILKSTVERDDEPRLP